MARLPQPGKDAGSWGTILNNFLAVEHNADGSLKVRADGTFYAKPAGGIPATDMTPGVQSSLAKASYLTDASSSDKGIVRLAGDLGGTAETPSVKHMARVFNVRDYGAKGDGLQDDSSAFAAAVTAAGTGTLYIPAGTYLISSEILLNDGMTVLGEGYNSCLKRRTGSAAYLVNIFAIRSGQHIRISNVRIDGQKQDIIDNHVATAQNGSHMYTTCNDIFITGDTSRDNPSREISIDNCWLHDAYYGNVEADDVDGLTITNCHIYHGRDNQINGRVNGYGGYCRNVTVSNNLVYGQGPIDTQNQFSGIQFLRGQYLTITGNTVYGLGNTETGEGNGIGLEGCRHVTITGNTVHHCLQQGVKVDRTVEGQPAYWDQTETYLKNEYVFYAGNKFYALQHSQGQTPPSSASSNAYWQYQSASEAQQFSTDVTISNNIIANNNYEDEYGVDTSGVFFQFCDKVLIVGNKLFGNTKGIVNGYNVGDVSVLDNSIENSEKEGIAFWNNDTQRSIPILRGNYISNSGAKGIDTVVPVIIEGNTVAHNAQAGISVAITGTVQVAQPVILVARNTLRDNGDSGILINGGFSQNVPVEVRENFAPASSIQPRLLGENGTPVRCVNNTAGLQAIELWYFSSAGSRWIDPQTQQLQAITADYAVQPQDQIILVTPSNNTTVTLPAPNGTHPPAHPGRTLTISKPVTSAFSVTAATTGGVINGPTTVADNESLRLVSDGTNWNVI